MSVSFHRYLVKLFNTMSRHGRSSISCLILQNRDDEAASTHAYSMSAIILEILGLHFCVLWVMEKVLGPYLLQPGIPNGNKGTCSISKEIEFSWMPESHRITLMSIDKVVVSFIRNMYTRKNAPYVFRAIIFKKCKKWFGLLQNIILTQEQKEINKNRK